MNITISKPELPEVCLGKPDAMGRIGFAECLVESSAVGGTVHGGENGGGNVHAADRARDLHSPRPARARPNKGNPQARGPQACMLVEDPLFPECLSVIGGDHNQCVRR